MSDLLRELMSRSTKDRGPETEFLLNFQTMATLHYWDIRGVMTHWCSSVVLRGEEHSWPFATIAQGVWAYVGERLGYGLGDWKRLLVLGCMGDSEVRLGPNQLKFKISTSEGQRRLFRIESGEVYHRPYPSQKYVEARASVLAGNREAHSLSTLRYSTETDMCLGSGPEDKFPGSRTHWHILVWMRYAVRRHLKEGNPEQALILDADAYSVELGPGLNMETMELAEQLGRVLDQNGQILFLRNWKVTPSVLALYLQEYPQSELRWITLTMNPCRMGGDVQLWAYFDSGRRNLTENQRTLWRMKSRRDAAAWKLARGEHIPVWGGGEDPHLGLKSAGRLDMQEVWIEAEEAAKVIVPNESIRLYKHLTSCNLENRDVRLPIKYG
jgi:hypothetical protein